jgi:hypothetical protein
MFLYGLTITRPPIPVQPVASTAATRVGTNIIIAVVSTVVGGATSTLVNVCDGEIDDKCTSKLLH